VSNNLTDHNVAQTAKNKEATERKIKHQ